MKKVLTKVGYMVFGCLLTLIGYHFGNVNNNSANAQENAPIVDEVWCRKLVIVGNDNTPRVTLGTDQFDYGSISVYSGDEELRVLLGVSDSDAGGVTLSSKESGGIAVALGVDFNGGYMTLYNKVIDEPILQTGVTNKGEGFILTRDKVGSDTDTIGPSKTFRFREKPRQLESSETPGLQSLKEQQWNDFVARQKKQDYTPLSVQASQTWIKNPPIDKLFPGVHIDRSHININIKTDTIDFKEEYRSFPGSTNFFITRDHGSNLRVFEKSQ